jgi:hypothetical protein
MIRRILFRPTSGGAGRHAGFLTNIPENPGIMMRAFKKMRGIYCIALNHRKDFTY